MTEFDPKRAFIRLSMKERLILIADIKSRKVFGDLNYKAVVERISKISARFNNNYLLQS